MNFDPIKKIAAPKVVTIEIAGQRFPMRFTLESLSYLEDNLSGTVFDFMQKLLGPGWPAVKMSDASRVLWAGCAHMGRSAPTEEECFNALAMEGAASAIIKLLESMSIYVNGAMDESESEDAEKKP